MRSDPPVTSVLNQCAETDHAAAGGISCGQQHRKMSNEVEKIAENEDLVPKRKVTSLISNYFGYKQDDIDQLCSLTIYVGKTQLSTTKSGKIGAGLNVHISYRRVKKNRNVSFFPYRAALKLAN